MTTRDAKSYNQKFDNKTLIKYAISERTLTTSSGKSPISSTEYMGVASN